jgi:hypothetical protein
MFVKFIVNRCTLPLMQVNAYSVPSMCFFTSNLTCRRNRNQNKYPTLNCVLKV